MERLIVIIDEIDLLPFFTLTVFISAINFTEIYRLMTECQKINKFILWRSRGNYSVDFYPPLEVNFRGYSVFNGIARGLIFSKKTPDKSG
ncbi:hypothetical protein BMD99_024545 [Klebsiella sp. PO552]|nr:hypothetical protein [Klebsiella quasivariicola]QBL52058.1 hypothetical protein BMD99_024545 [Klebsiella sp. PO552]